MEGSAGADGGRAFVITALTHTHTPKHTTHNNYTTTLHSGSLRLTASAAYTAGPRHALFGLTLGNIWRQDAMSSASDFMRVEGVPVSDL